MPRGSPGPSGKCQLVNMHVRPRAPLMVGAGFAHGEHEQPGCACASGVSDHVQNGRFLRENQLNEPLETKHHSACAACEWRNFQNPLRAGTYSNSPHCPRGECSGGPTWLRDLQIARSVVVDPGTPRSFTPGSEVHFSVGSGPGAHRQSGVCRGRVIGVNRYEMTTWCREHAARSQEHACQTRFPPIGHAPNEQTEKPVVYPCHAGHSVMGISQGIARSRTL